VWANVVVVRPPALNDDLGLAQAVKDLTIQQFVAPPGIERFDVAVLL
jgi:hypothetical protein